MASSASSSSSVASKFQAALASVGQAFRFGVVLFLILPPIFSHFIGHSPKILVPFSDSDEILAEFLPACLHNGTVGDKDSGDKGCPVLGEGFFFGLATAAAHAEDELNDAWLDFALKADGVRAWHNHAVPEQRLRFWTHPQAEIDLAAETGVEALRVGLDWGRLVPEEPLNGTKSVVDWKAVERYKEILRMVRERGMRVMLTLFHHSFPKWGSAYGGWTDPRSIKYFAEFAELAVSEFDEFVDYWVTFNEPHIFSFLTHCIGIWPPGFKPSLLHSALCATPVSAFSHAMGSMAEAHIAAFTTLKTRSIVPVGIAHNVGMMTAFSVLDIPVRALVNAVTLFAWTDKVVDHLDFCGLNYYGQEFLSIAGLQLVEEEEYSEAGRGVYPDGLFRLLVAFHRRYNTDKRRAGREKGDLRFVVTENGIADSRDVIRRPYLVEHLLALSAAMKAGVPVDGYFHWTISDNWEWADGYCPAFGLVKVERENGLARRLRPSYHLFSKIVKERKVLRQQREDEWGTLQRALKSGSDRPFCRGWDDHGRMSSAAVDVPVLRKYASKDWRFGKYKLSSGALFYIVRPLQIFRAFIADVLQPKQQVEETVEL